jgi:hypothetical protein
MYHDISAIEIISCYANIAKEYGFFNYDPGQKG